MQDTRNLDALAAALFDVVGLLNSPRQDDVLLRLAGVSLDRAMFPLLARLGASPGMSVAQLADAAGRDASTISRQVAKLEELGLVKRVEGGEDLRVRAVAVTRAGGRIVDALARARRTALAELTGRWSQEEQEMFPLLLRKFADAMRATQQALRSEMAPSAERGAGRGRRQTVSAARKPRAA
ncbi:MAG: MarR family transcriptional regulator [Proteobacteria bacterium]|nr:MarR family transcriptional regulator [Pseudomonadota bacterium]